MKTYTSLYHIVRVSLGLPMFIFGVNKWYIFIPIKISNLAGQQFIDSLYASGYLMQLVGLTQFLCGLFLFINRFVPLALVCLFPVTVNILFFNLFLNQIGAFVGILVFVAHLFLVYFHRNSYTGLISS